MKFKKVYIEITNNCNLDCSFCIKNNREKKFMSIDEFEKVINNIKHYTNHIYLHLMGEPLLHPKINELINIAHDNNINVNITTNGYLINRIKTANIRQINISLHSYDSKYNVSLDDYLNNIFESINKLNNTYINYRLWVNSDNYEKIKKILEEKYNKEIKPNDIGNFKLDNNVFISFKEEFNWPTLINDREGDIAPISGSCRALKDHIGILSNLDVVACCLDSNGDICFGNLNNNFLEDILNTKRFINMKKNLENNIKTEKLCINCNFYK